MVGVDPPIIRPWICRWASVCSIFTWFFTWCGLNCDQATGETQGLAGIHKKPILVSRICFNLCLKLIIFSTSTTCCSRLFHLSTTLREKKCFIDSLLLQRADNNDILSQPACILAYRLHAYICLNAWITANFAPRKARDLGTCC